MLARCARCQGTFTTDRYGRQTCPHCGSELILPPPPGTPPEAAEAPPPPEAPLPPPSGGTSGESATGGGGIELPPPPGPPPGGYGPPPGWGPQGGGWASPPGGSPPPGGGWPPPGRPPPGAGPESPSPFADRARLGFFHAFFETWKLVATRPEEFFSRVRIDQTGSALLFGAIAATIGSVFSAFYGWLSTQQIVSAMQGMTSGMSEDQARFMRMWMETYASGAMAVGQVLLTPVAVFVGSYVLAGLLHLLLKLFRGAQRRFDATLTVVAYVNGLGLLLAVPGCGSLIVMVWSLVAVVVGLAAVHRCGTVRAAAAVLAPAALLLVCCCSAFGIGMPALFKAAQEASKQGPTTTL